MLESHFKARFIHWILAREQRLNPNNTVCVCESGKNRWVNKLQRFEYVFSSLTRVKSNQRKYNACIDRLGWNSNALCHFECEILKHWCAAVAYHVLSSDSLLYRINFNTIHSIWLIHHTIYTISGAYIHVKSLHFMVTETLCWQNT